MLNAFRNLHSPGKNGRVFGGKGWGGGGGGGVGGGGGGGGGGGTVSRTNDQLLKFRHLQHVLNMDKFP